MLVETQTLDDSWGNIQQKANIKSLATEYSYCYSLSPKVKNKLRFGTKLLKMTTLVRKITSTARLKYSAPTSVQSIDNAKEKKRSKRLG